MNGSWISVVVGSVAGAALGLAIMDIALPDRTGPDREIDSALQDIWDHAADEGVVNGYSSEGCFWQRRSDGTLIASPQTDECYMTALKYLSPEHPAADDDPAE